MYWRPISSAARQAGVLHLPDERAVGVEDLDALILAVGHPEQALGIDGDAVSDFELPGLLAFAAPRLDEPAGLVELQHPRVAARPRRVSLHDEDVAVAGDGDVVRLIQLARSRRLVPLAGLAFRAQREQHLSLRVELETMCAPTSVAQMLPSRIDPQAVRPGEQAVAERANERAVRVELEERLGAARQHEQVAFGVERHAGGRPIVVPAGSVIGFGTAT